MKNKTDSLEAFYTSKRLIRILSAVFMLVITVLLSLALCLDFEPEIRLFKGGSYLIYIAEISALVFSVAVVLMTFILVPRAKELSVFPDEAEYKPYYKVEEKTVKIARFICAATVFAEGIVKVCLLLSENGKAYLPAPITATMLVLFVPFTLYFLPEIVNRATPKYEKTHLICGTFGILWFILSVINTYFDTTVAFSSPYRVFGELAMISVMLAFVYEIKLHTDNPFPRARLASLAAAFILCGGFSVARILMLLCGKVVSAYDTAEIVTEIGFTVYFAARLFYYNED